MTAERFYVRRQETTTGRVGWIGPIRGAEQAEREKAAWEAADGRFRWDAYVIPATADVRRHVNAWQAQKNKEHGR